MFAQNRVHDHYNFAAEPKVVNHRAKYREYPAEEPQQIHAMNIMYDRRVVRGNTYAAIVTTTRDVAQQMKSTEPRLKKTWNQALETGEQNADRADVSTPRAVEGRCHINLQTDENVELLTDKPPNYEKDTQTDFYIERPLARLYMPVKTGDDRETQIWDGELFDFDHEVEPILQVLIGKALEQGRMEVLEEEELRMMKAEQKRFDDLRFAEIAEAQRMEAEERRRMEENERRKRQHAIKKEQSVTSHKKLLSRAFAKEFLKNVRGDTFNSLVAQGTFQDHLEFEMNHTMLPWLVKDIMELCQGNNAVINTIKTITATVTQNLEDIHKKAVLAEQERRRLAKEEKERLEREKQERRHLRAEARKKRIEEERRRVLTEKITEMLISKGEQKPDIFTQPLSDLDSFGKEGMTVGLVGGVIGEILLILSTIDDIKKVEESDPLYSLKNIQISKDAVQKIVDYIVSDKVKDGKIEIGVTEDIEAQLEAIEAGLTLETIHTMPNKAAEIRKLLGSSINSFVLKSIQEASEKLSVKVEYVDMIKQAIINTVLSADEEGRKIKLVKTPLDYTTDTRLEAIAVFMPNTEEMPLFNLGEAKGVKPNKKGGKANVEVPEPDETVPPTSAEIDYEDLVSVIPLHNEELRVLVSHKPASIVFRREVLMFMSSIYKELDMKEIEVLKRVNQKADAVEEAIANKFEKNLTVLVFDRQ